MPSVPHTFPSTEQGCHRGSQGGKPPVPPPGTPDNDTTATGLEQYALSAVLLDMECCGICGGCSTEGGTGSAHSCSPAGSFPCD